MNRAPSDQRPLFDPWLPWELFPDSVRQHALQLLTALCLETLDLSRMESEPDDAHDS